MKILTHFALLATALGLAACSGQSPTPNETSEAMTNGHVGNSHIMSEMDMSSPTPSDSPATKGFKESMTGMMTAAPGYTGDADIDFMQQMRVHHRAAITMSEIQLEYGTDNAARTLAEQILAEQRREIAEIDKWLAARQR